MKELNCFKYADESGGTKRLFVTEEVGAKWKNLGRALNFSQAALANIEANHRQVEDCCAELLSQWLRGITLNPNQDSSSICWRSLIEALEDARCPEVARVLSEALSS